MQIFNFYPRFAGLVASGSKRQTVRARSVLPGELVQLQCGGIVLGTGCITCVREVFISYRDYVPTIRLDASRFFLSSKCMEDFARRDGFPGLDEFIHFFAEYYDLPFNGFVIEWDLQEQAVAA